MQVQSLSREDPLEKEMATYSSKELDTTERACTHTRDIKSMSPGGHRACLQNEASAKRKGKDCLIPETIHG